MQHYRGSGRADQFWGFTNTMHRLFLAGALAAASLFASAAGAVTTTVTSGTRGVTIASSGPIGQSFTPTEGLLNAFGFQFAVANAGVADASLTFSLLEGAGLNGAVLATRSATLSSLTGRTPTWYDFDLGSVAVTIGRSYTAVVSSASTRLALIVGPNLSTSGVPASGDAYAAGSLVFTRPVDSINYCGTSGACDANFRFTTAAAAAVPEPATWATLLLGVGAAGGAMRVRRRRAALRAA